MPDPDLLIRTSGELRLSNFLLWQSAYTEFVFLEAYWPDFGRELLEQAIDEFRRRNRRFGGVVARSTGLTDERESERRRMSEHDEAGDGAGARPDGRARLGSDFAPRLVSGLAMGAVAALCTLSGRGAVCGAGGCRARAAELGVGRVSCTAARPTWSIAVHVRARLARPPCWRRSATSASGCSRCRSAPSWRCC